MVIYVELTSCVRLRKQLTVFKSRLKHSYFVGPSTSTHNRLPPALMKSLNKYVYSWADVWAQNKIVSID